LLVLPNGCDFGFWREGADRVAHPRPNVALFQGGINARLDVLLLQEVLRGLPDWEFWFCGPVDPTFKEWPTLLSCKNLKYLGNLVPEELRTVTYEATVGLIPFLESPIFTERSLPLKAFEYAACGLPVVSIPIRALHPFRDVFRFASGSDAFCRGIVETAKTRYDGEALTKRVDTAREQDYEKRFDELLAFIESTKGRKVATVESLEVLVLYDANSLHVSTIVDHLESFRSYSANRIHYAAACGNAASQLPLALFDAIVIHYSVRLSLDDHVSRSFAEALRATSCFKVLFIQDEYDATETARRWIEDLGVHCVFTCVPERYVHTVYPRSRFPHVKFVPTLTGYVPAKLESGFPHQPIAARSILLGYRGRDLPYWYGNLGQEKILIGKQMRTICEERGLPIDIEWTSDKRIYGEDWFKFLASCRAVLGTESGSNVFDDHGHIRRQIEEAHERQPNLTYEDAFEQYIAPHEGHVVMNQISPKIFEAIALRTALVLFEGTYSGVIRPNDHFIALKKDFSNVDEVLERLRDARYLTDLAERAYRDVILSGRFSYRSFVRGFDQILSAQVPRHNSVKFATAIHAYATMGDKRWLRGPLSHGKPGNVSSLPLSAADLGEIRRASHRRDWVLELLGDVGLSLWSALPVRLRTWARSTVARAVRLGRRILAPIAR